MRDDKDNKDKDDNYRDDNDDKDKDYNKDNDDKDKDYNKDNDDKDVDDNDVGDNDVDDNDKDDNKDDSDDDNDTESKIEATESETPTSDYVDNYKKAMKEMNEFDAKRKQDEHETEKLIATYNNENKNYLSQKTKFVGTVYKLLQKICGTDDTDIVNVAFHAIYSLIRMKYFFDYNYSRVCNFRPSIMCNYQVFCDRSSIESVIYIGALIVEEEQKIKPIIEDVVHLFKVYGDYVYSMQLEISWNQIMKRMILTRASISSSEMRRYQRIRKRRLRDKYRYRIKGKYIKSMIKNMNEENNKNEYCTSY